MDFQSLSRKELQILCKMNKIPANITNVAMADALADLTKVEGIDEIGRNPQSVLQTPQTRPLVDRSRSDMLKTPATRTRTTAGACKIVQQETSHVYATRRSTRLVSRSAAQGKAATQAIQISALSEQEEESHDLFKKPSHHFTTEETPNAAHGQVDFNDANSTTEDSKDNPAPVPVLEDNSNLGSQESTFGYSKPDNPRISAAEEVSDCIKDLAEETPNAAHVRVVFNDLAVGKDNNNLESRDSKDNSTPEDNSNLGSQESAFGYSKADKLLISAAEEVSVCIAEETNSFDLNAYQHLVLEDGSDATVEVLGSVSEKTNNSKGVANGDNVVSAADTSHAQVSSDATDLAVDNSTTKDNSSLESAFGDSKANRKDLIPADGSADAMVSVSVEVLGSVIDIGLERSTPEKPNNSEGEEFIANGDNVMSDDTCNAEAEQILVPLDDASSGHVHQVVIPLDDNASNADQLLIPTGEPVAVISSQAPDWITAKEDVLSFTRADIDAGADNDQDHESDQLLGGENAQDLGLTSACRGELPDPMQSRVDKYSIPEGRVSKMEDGNSDAVLDNSLLFGEMESESGNSDKKRLEQLTSSEFHLSENIEPWSCKNQEADGPMSLPSEVSADIQLDVVDRLENASDSEIGIMKMKAGSSVEVQVEVEKLDNQNFSWHSEAQGWETDFDANVSIEGTPLSSSVTNSRHLLSMALEVLDGDKMDVMVAAEEKENNTSAAMNLRNLVVAEEKEKNMCKSEDSTRKLKKMVDGMVSAEDKDKATPTVLDDNKENNTNTSLRKKNVVVAEETEKNKGNCENNKALKNTSLRKLKKMFKEKLEIGDNGKSGVAKEQMQLEKRRPALQTLTDNCLVQCREN